MTEAMKAMEVITRHLLIIGSNNNNKQQQQNTYDEMSAELENGRQK